MSISTVFAGNPAELHGQLVEFQLTASDRLKHGIGQFVVLANSGGMPVIDLVIDAPSCFPMERTVVRYRLTQEALSGIRANPNPRGAPYILIFPGLLEVVE